jgi:hypothetical protein
MSQIVFDALKEQEKATRKVSEYVFCTRTGAPLDHKNVTNRVWHPLLRHLGLAKRRPYQCRHTAATLWLASGESPQWIARQLGHTTTEMLFRVYARYVPNLTRRDGSAFERLITQSIARHPLPVESRRGEPPCLMPVKLSLSPTSQPAPGADHVMDRLPAGASGSSRSSACPSMSAICCVNGAVCLPRAGSA